MSFLVVGEALVDLISDAGSWRFEAAPGGSPLNVAVGLAAAGHPVRLASEIGDDLFGGLVRDHLARYGVATTECTGIPATNLAFARVDEAGVASYDFRFGWGWPGPAALTGVDCLHTGSLATVVSPGADAVAQAVAAARRRGATISYDPNVRPSLFGDRRSALARIEPLVAAADLVKVSSEDLAWLYPGTPERTAAARWAQAGPRLVVVTRGGDGAVALHRGGTLECTAPRVPVVDTVGAGDTFTAALLSRLAGPLAAEPAGPGDEDLAAGLRHATAAAAAVCARHGADPPPPDAVEALLPGAVLQRLG